MLEPPTKWPPNINPPEGLINSCPSPGSFVIGQVLRIEHDPIVDQLAVLPIGTKPSSPMVIMNWATKASWASMILMSEGFTPAA